MRIQTEWLRELAPNDLNARQMAELLTRLGFEVEEAAFLDDVLAEVRMGLVTDKQPHPDAPDMFVCQLDLGEHGQRQIVCASAHPIEIGWLVPVAPPGLDLPTGIPIREGRFRGVESAGMICMDRELGVLPRGSGLQYSTDVSLKGVPVCEAFNIGDALIEVAVLPNRPDAMGLVGIAREVAAATGGELRLPPTDLPACDLSADPGVTVRVDDAVDCPRYTARAIEGVTVAPSPEWLVARLQLVGFRAINNVVDVTNYVLYEQGQPLHAFDRARLGGGEIVVRRATADESIALLDDSAPVLTAEHIVIADANGPVALAGVMGGLTSGVETSTTDVVIECAAFDPVRVRRTSRALHVRSDSSSRFERGVDANDGVSRGGARCARLILELAGGKLVGAPIDVYPSPVVGKILRVPPRRISDTLGIEIPDADARRILSEIGYRWTDDDHVQAPTWRVDAYEAVVAIEDVARHYGYEKLEERPARTYTRLHANPPEDQTRQLLRRSLLGQGFWEARAYGLDEAVRLSKFRTGDEVLLPLSNPETQDMGTLRNSLLPRLLDAVRHNARRQRRPLRFFEVDRTFHAGNAPAGRWTCAGVVFGPAVDTSWSGVPTATDFYRLKGAVENALADLRLGARVQFGAAERPYLHPGVTAAIRVDGAEIGVVARLHPELQAEWGLNGPVHVFELDVQALAELQLASARARYSQVPRLPAVSRDLALVAPISLPAAELMDTIRGAGGELVEEVRCFDTFQGGDLAEGTRSLAFAVRYRATDRTLTAEEVGAAEARILVAAAAVGAQLRA